MNNRLSDHQEKQTDLPMLTIKGRTTLLIVQAGMGIGVSGWLLSGSTAGEWGIGTLSSIAHSLTPAYRHILDEMLRIKSQNGKIRLSKEEQQQVFYEANLICIKMEVQKALEKSQWNGSIYMNVMVATNDYENQVHAACKAWVHGIVSGAGTPMKLATILNQYPDVAFIPIFSDASDVERFIVALKKKGMKHEIRLPDAIVLEDPSRAAWHLWAKGREMKNIHDSRTTLEISIPATVEILKKEGLDIPVIAAGWIVNRSDIDRMIALWASGVQLGTRFLATYESGASDEFKEAVIHATPEDIIEYTSNAMLPARGLGTSGIFHHTPKRAAHVRGCVYNCLSHCAFRDGQGELPSGDRPAQMCIARALAAATAGNPLEARDRALYFASASALSIRTLKSVEEIMNELAYSQK